jgi:hypothetical protein
LSVRLAAGVVLLIVCVLLAVNGAAQADGAVPYLFAAFALCVSLTFLSAAWAPLWQLRHADSYRLVLAPAGVALEWSGNACGLAFAEIADASVRRRSFRAVFSQDLILSQADGRELVLPVGELFGEPRDLLTAVLERTRRARGLPPREAG